MTEPRLRLLSSDRLEALADDLARRMEAAPRGPLEDEIVVVGSRGMARWLNLHLARAHGIAASIDTPFPFTWARRTVDRLLDREADPARDPFGAQVLPWRVHQVLGRLDALDLTDDERAPLVRYLADDDGRRRGQLARRLAGQFVNYQAMRHEELARWERGGWFADAPLESVGERWQRALWLRLRAEAPDALPLSAALVDALRRLHEGDARGALPPRLTVFGVTSLPRTVLHLIRGVAAHAEVTVSIVNPTAQFVASSETRRRPRFERIDPDDAHPLLAAWGKLGIELQEELLAVAEDTDFETVFAPKPVDSVLTAIQQDLLDARVPDAPAALDRPRVAAGDRSLRVHLCHSPRREIEVLRDEILRAFEDGVVTSPSDVLVLVPDVEAYAPFVRAVFESERPTTAGPVRLRVRIADGRDASEDDASARLALLLLERAGGRAAATEILEILETPAVAARFGLDGVDTSTIRDLVRRAGIRFGRDPEERERALAVPRADAGTWREGLDRMLLGYAVGPSDDAIDGLLPLGDTTTGRREVIGRLARAVDAVFDELDGLLAPRSVRDWSLALRDALLALTAVDDADAAAERAEFLAQLDGFARVAVDDPSVVRRTFRDALAARLDDDAAGRGFVSGRITVAELRPMRSIPYPMIAVAGLDADSFPRRDPAEGLDLIAARRRRGDRTPRLDDRQMLLEVLGAARRRLVFTAVGFDPRDNSERARSVCLEELGETIDRSFALADGESARTPAEGSTVNHRLQPFHALYGAPDARDHFTYDDAVVTGARALRSDALSIPRFADEALDAPDVPRDARERVVIPLDDLVAFWRKPCDWFVKRVLRIATHFDEEDIDRDALKLTPLATYQVRRLLLDEGIAGVDTTALARIAERGVSLVSGASGRLDARDALDTTLDRLHGEVPDPAGLVPRPIDVSGSSWRVQGSLDLDPASGLVDVIANREAKPDAAIGTWIRHVAWGAVREDDDPVPWISRVQPASSAARGWIGGVDDPVRVLGELVEGFLEGQRRPLHFFAATTAKWWSAYDASDPDEARARRAAWSVAASTWSDEEQGRGDGLDEAVVLCTRGLDDPVDDDFVRWARLFGPAWSKQVGVRELKKAP